MYQPAQYQSHCCDKREEECDEETPDLLVSVGVNPSQVLISQGTAVAPPVPTGEIRINFNNLYVNQPLEVEQPCPERCPYPPLSLVPYDQNRFGYFILRPGTYEVDLSLSVFLLILGLPTTPPTPPPGPPIVLTNLVRFTVSVWAEKPNGTSVQLASRSGLFDRTGSLAAENNGTIYAMNDIQQANLHFMVDTNNNRQHNVAVGDLIYATMAVNTRPVGNFLNYSISIISAGQVQNQYISSSFFNVKRVSTYHAGI